MHLKKVAFAYNLEIPLSFAFGWLTDLYGHIIPELSFTLSINIILTMFITAMGVYLSVKTDLVLIPTGGIVKTISEVFHFSFSTVKNPFSIFMYIIIHYFSDKNRLKAMQFETAYLLTCLLF